MKRVSKGNLKAKMYEIFREIEASNEEIIVTDRGVPALRIVPLVGRKRLPPEEIFGEFRDKVVYHEPVETPESEDWGELI